MAINIKDLIKTEGNGLLSKINIGGKIYELKDLVARENAEALALLIDALSAKVGNVAEGQNLADIVKNIQENAYDDTELQKAIDALEANKADKTQVATDIENAVKAEAALREAADNELDGRLDKVETFFELAEGEKLDAALDTLKEIQDYVNSEAAAADEMVKDIAANAKAIEDEAKARAEADEAIDGRLDVIEAALGDGDGSVADQIAGAKQEAIDAAKGYTDGEIDKVEAEVAKKEDKANLKALAYKDSASGSVAGQTISGVKANGQSAGSITVELEQTSHAMNSTGKYTPAGNVSGSVVAAGDIAVTAKYDAADAVLSKGDYTPAGTVTSDFGHTTAAAELIMDKHAPEGSVSVALSGNTFNAITGVGTQASFVEGAFTPAALDYAAADYSVAKEGIVGTVDGETLTFTDAGLQAISASKINSFSGGSKASDQFTANSLPTMASQTVGVQSATFTGVEHNCVTGVKYDKATMSALTFAGTKAEGALVTGVSYQKADIGSATFTGKSADIVASFAGSEGDIKVAGTCHDYAVKTAQFNPAAIEVAVGDIVVSEKNVTVQ